MRYGREEITGTVTIYNILPSRWQINRTWINLQKATSEIQTSQGFYPIVDATPTADQEKETLLPSDLVDGHYIERVRDLSQAEIDERDALQLEQSNRGEVETQLNNARQLAIRIFVFIRKDNVGLTENQKGVLISLAKLLMQGDIEQAQTDFNAIARPTNANKMQKVYDKLKIEFDNL